MAQQTPMDRATIIQKLIGNSIASRIHEKDASVYNFSAEAEEYSSHFMGWTNLASKPPVPLEDIREFADRMAIEGITSVVLVGEGGSTQAPMTITKFNKLDGNRMEFRTLESDSPVRVREIIAEFDPKETLVIMSSKSGGTIEPRMLMLALRQEFLKTLSPEELPNHLMAITDPGSDLEQQALDEGWICVFSGEPTVGGRFSALSVFGLVPTALVGLDLEHFVERARKAENDCSRNDEDNPAIQLASFLYANYLEGRDKFSFVTNRRGRVLGLWIEQLIAESLGKDGKSLLPALEVEPVLLATDYGDRSAIIYHTATETWDEADAFDRAVACIDESIPRLSYKLETAYDLAEHFLMWEYATAMLGYLMEVSPFDQPDVASAKAVVKEILKDGMPEPQFTGTFTRPPAVGEIEVRTSPQYAHLDDVCDVIAVLLNDIGTDDFFSLNAFIPFTGEGRKEALESLRHDVAEAFGCVATLEIGPRYLHSVGQLQKGGKDNGVYLIISAEEPKDIVLPEGSDAPTLGTLAKAQAVGDAITLANRGRRVAELHLPDQSAATLRALVQEVRLALSLIGAHRSAHEEE